MVRRSLIVLGTAAAVLTLGFVSLFATGGSGNPKTTGALPTLPATTTTYPTPTTETTIVVLTGPRGGDHRTTLELVVVPNVVGMTLEQADPMLSATGLSAGGATTSTSTPSGQSPTGTILAQEPAPGSQVSLDTVIQLNISGY
jgi:beta-lactam-binding protein with PASTA domain